MHKSLASLLVFLMLVSPLGPVLAQEAVDSDVPAPETDLTIPPPEQPGDQTETPPTDIPEETATDDQASTNTTTTEDTSPITYPIGANKQTISPEIDQTTGALNYKYPITVPPGRNNLTPDISIVYNSSRQENDSIVGYGWNLDIPYIERVNKTGTENLYTANNYTSSLSGELTLVSGATWAARNEDTNFLNYQYSGGSWTVKDKSGTTYVFGETAQARQDDPGDATHVYKWMLESVTDANGNFISYTYYKDSGQIYPSLINYTGHDNSSGPFEVEFERESQPHPMKIASPAFLVATNYRIKTITAKFNNDWVKKYALTYTTTVENNRSLLAGVQETGQDENGTVTTLPATTFDYTSNNGNFSWVEDSGWQNGPIWSGPFNSTNDDTQYIFADVNGDGFIDGVSDQKYFFNTGKGWNPTTNGPLLPVSIQDHNTTKKSSVRVLDVNGDGLPDILFGYTPTNSSKTYLNVGGTAWTQNAYYNNITPMFDSVAFHQLDDLNGDGLLDIVCAAVSWSCPGGGVRAVYKNNGFGWTISNDFPYSFDYIDSRGKQHDSGVRLIDLNGDQLADVSNVSVSEGNVHYINNGKSWVNAGYPGFVPTNMGNSKAGGTSQIGDINGDGLTDIVCSDTTYNGSYSPPYKNCGNLSTVNNVTDDKMLYINNGYGFDAKEIPNVSLPSFELDRYNSHFSVGAYLMDMNGDGLSDIVTGSNLNNVISSKVLINQGIKSQLLKTVTSSTGSESGISYKPSTSYRDANGNLLNPKLAQVVYTVSSIVTDPGKSNEQITFYTYAGGYYYYKDAFDRKFAGFGLVTSTDSAGNITKTYYHQGNGANIAPGEYNDHIAKAGKIYRVEEYDNAGNLYRLTVNKWDRYNIDTQYDFIKLARETVFTYDGDGTHRDIATEYLYDDFNGNLNKKIEYGEVAANDDGSFSDISSDTVTTSYTYATDEGNKKWAVASENATDQNSNKVKESRYFYDNLPIGQLSKGNITKKEDWKSPEGSSSNFITSPSFLQESAPLTVKALIVGGGGGGGMGSTYQGGGGGAGGYQENNSVPVSVQAYAIQVGNGGVPATSTGYYAGYGIPSSAFGISSWGGGGGASGVRNVGLSNSTYPYHVGSGSGGAGGSSKNQDAAGGQGTPGQGNEGGTGKGSSTSTSRSGGGGGGAGGPGGNITGGAGRVSSISGSAVTYATGGEGGHDNPNNHEGLSGRVNTGEGGAGTGGALPGAGGSGIVIISYLTADFAGYIVRGGTITTNGANTVHTFKSSETFTISTPIIAPPQETPPAPTGGYVNTQKTYNDYGLVTDSTDANGNTTHYVYDSFNLYPASIANPLNQTTNLTYDYSSGKVKQTTDQNGFVYQNIYDGLDRILEEKVPNSSSPYLAVNKTTYEYSDIQNAMSVHKKDYLDQPMDVDTYQYFDGLGRLIQERKEAENSGDFNVRDIAYDSRGLTLKESLPHESSGSSKTSPTGTGTLYTNYTYDPLERPLTVINALGNTTYLYDNWKTTITDANGKVKNYYKDAYENLVKVDEINGGSTYTTNYDWNLNGKLIKITDALGNVRNFTYDGLGRRLTAEDLHAPGDGTFGVWNYAYDNAGNLVQTTNPKSQTINYVYDHLNRISTEDYTATPGTEVTYTYDSCTKGVGKLCLTEISGGAKTSLTYDSNGNVASETKTINSVPYGTSYTYDRQGNQLEITNPDLSKVKYGYNKSGLLELVQQKSNGDAGYTNVVTNFDYSPSGQISTIAYANGVTMNNTYDADKMYRLARRLTENSASLKLQDLNYTYDNVGNITNLVDNSETDAKRTVAYTYDDLYRLTSATATNVATGQAPYTENYTYDAIGNITSKTTATAGQAGQGTYHYDGTVGASYANPHAVTSTDGNSTTYVYDNNGNLVTSGPNSYTWDYNNRLKQAIVGNITSTYTYDSSGQRLTSSNGINTTIYPNQNYNIDSSGVVTKHIFAGPLLLATVAGSSSIASGTTPTCTPPESGDWTITASCTFTGTALAPASIIINAGQVLTLAPNSKLFIDFKHYKLIVKKTGGVLIKKTATLQQVKASDTVPAIAYINTDHLSGSSIITNQSGTILETEDYFPFGTIRIDKKAGNFSEQRKFIGQEYDTDTGFDYLNARYYKADTGRFVSEDPVFLNPEVQGKEIFAKFLEDPQSQNSYSYAKNNPITLKDPDGKFAFVVALPSLGLAAAELLGGIAAVITSPVVIGTVVVGGIIGGVYYFSQSSSKGGLAPDGLLPPVADPGSLVVEPTSKTGQKWAGEQTYWEPNGTEWRYHPEDKDHNPHWDKNSHEKWNSPTERIPIDNKPILKDRSIPTSSKNPSRSDNKTINNKKL